MNNKQSKLITVETLDELYELLSGFELRAKEIENSLPYQINFIKEMHANENAHNRFLRSLLLYKENNTYPFLKSFLFNLGGEFDKLKINKPIITAEKHRIDVLILDKKGNYAIIIENKIRGAIDQDKQIDTYYKLVEKKYGKNIKRYVLYLTKDGGSPSNNSLGFQISSDLGNKYKEINYSDNILPWLENYVLPECKVKDTLLHSALTQYIDYLKGLFNLRNIDKKMNKEIQDYLTKKLNIKGDEIEEYNFLLNEKNRLNELTVQYNLMMKDLVISQHKKWNRLLEDVYKESITSNIVSNGIIVENPPKIYPYFGVLFTYKEVEFSYSIGFDEYHEVPFHGFSYRGTNMAEKKYDAVRSLVDELFKNIENIKETSRWYGYQIVPLDSIFEKFKANLDILNNHNEVNKITVNKK